MLLLAVEVVFIDGNAEAVEAISCYVGLFLYVDVVTLC